MFEQDDGEYVGTLEEASVRAKLKGWYHNVDMIVQTMKENPGKWVATTGLAHYRWVEKRKRCQSKP